MRHQEFLYELLMTPSVSGHEEEIQQKTLDNMADICDLQQVDATYVSDCPGTRPQDTGKVSLGGGPVLCAATIVNKNVNRLLEETAKELGISLQWEVASGHTGTDADRAHVAAGGIPVALVSIPLRYMHSSVEVANRKDIQDCIELLAGFLTRITPDFSFTSLKPAEK